MNKGLQKAKDSAKRTLKIIELLEGNKDVKDREIMDKTGAERQLIAYYRRLQKDD